MNQFNKEFWTNRYQNNETGWDLGAPSTPLKEYIDQLKDKNLSILIPGAGNAYEAEYLFSKEFKNITVIDISLEPLKNIQKRLPDFPKENLIFGDFFDHNKQYDLILEQTFFCALDPSLRKKYVEQMYNLLKPSGKLVGVVFTEPLNTKMPPFAASKEEYLALFSPKFNIKVFETCYNSIKPREGREMFINLEKK
ncbi:MAG: methyltransferase [Bacteroidetes bacterium]|nr:methyltransferase [Bacteroidota bacterium]